MKFRIGSKVNLINDNLWRSSKDVGAIVGIDAELDTHYYKVKFATIGSGKEYCLWLDENVLETYVKFKVGDKVRVESNNYSQIKGGRAGTIIKVDNSGFPFYVKFSELNDDGSDCLAWFNHDELELVDDNKESN